MRKLLTYLLKILKLLAILAPIIISLFALWYSHKANSLSTRLAHLHIEPEINTSFYLKKDEINPTLTVASTGNIPVTSLSGNYQVFILDKKTVKISAAASLNSFLAPGMLYSWHLKPGERTEFQLLGIEAPDCLVVYEFDFKYFRESDMREYKEKDYWFIDNNKILILSQFRTSSLYHDTMSNIASFSFNALNGEPNQVIKQPHLKHSGTIKMFLPKAVPGSKVNVIRCEGFMVSLIPYVEGYNEICERYKKALEINPDNYSTYSNWGNALYDLAKRKEGTESDRFLIEACEKYKKTIELEPEKYEAYINWGACLGELAKRKEGEDSNKLFTETCEKWKKAIEIKSDLYDAYINWSLTLLNWSYKKQGEEKNKLINDAILLLKRLEELKRGKGAYYLAYIYGLNDENECQKWLKIGEEEQTLPERQEAMVNPAFEKVRDKQWFKNIRWKGE